MIQTNHSTSVSWTSAAPSTSAAVPPVLAVAPAATQAGDRQGTLGQGNGNRQERAPTPADGNAAERAPPPPTLAEQAARAAESQARREARAEAQRETVERLREALRRIWDASGAVVEQALAREAREAQARAAEGGASTARLLDAYNEPSPPGDAPGSRLSRRA